MNCSDFEMNVRALARSELIDAARRDVILGHVENCLRCAALLAGEQALIAGVRAVVAELAGQKAPAHVRAALLTAFREYTSSVVDNKVIRMPPKVARYWRLEAAAAAILILVSTWAVLWIYSDSAIEKRVALQVTPAAAITAGPLSPAVKTDAEIVADSGIAHPNRSRHRAARHNTRAAEQVTEFFPLMDGIDLDSLEAVQAVRVELPTSALNDLGLQGGREMPAGSLKADVLLGQDGVARAIRFIR